MFRKLKDLFTSLTIYGLGDVATSIISFFLLPVYVRFLSPEDYGVISLLVAVEAVAKIVFRGSVDASFMRLYYDCHDQPSRQKLASTVFFFLFAASGITVLVMLAVASPLAAGLFGAGGHTFVLRLVLVNTFIVSFFFIPFFELRIKGEAPVFLALTFSRSAATLVLRLLLVVVVHLGVLGVVLADIVVSVVFSAVLVRWFAPLIRPVFSRATLREVLRFGLPRLPQGVAQQVISVVDRYLLSLFVTLREVGLYSIGATFAMSLKLFLSAFELAWTPFYLATMKERDATRTLSAIVTYGLAVLVVLVAGLSATATPLVRMMTTADFYQAADVVPWVALGVMAQGVYLLTSVGLTITKRTEYYPIATGAAAVTSVTANLVLIPRFGALGAAWANAMAHLVLATLSFHFSQRFYPIRYEGKRILRIAVAGLVAYTTAMVVVPSSWPPVVDFLARGSAVVVLYPLVLLITGFLRPQEARLLRELLSRWPRRWGRTLEPVADDTQLAGEIVTTTLPDAAVDQGGMDRSQIDHHRSG